jgi:hypothetical protein
MKTYLLHTKSGSYYHLEPPGFLHHLYTLRKEGVERVFYFAGYGDARTGEFNTTFDPKKVVGKILFFHHNLAEVDRLLNKLKQASPDRAKFLMQSFGNTTRIIEVFERVAP